MSADPSVLRHRARGLDQLAHDVEHALVHRLHLQLGPNVWRGARLTPLADEVRAMSRRLDDEARELRGRARWLRSEATRIEHEAAIAAAALPTAITAGMSSGSAPSSAAGGWR